MADAVVVDDVGEMHQAVAEARTIATRAGDCPGAWELLALAGAMETEAHAIAAEQDALS